MKLAALLLLSVFASTGNPKTSYRCKPCGYPCDAQVHTAAGSCEACHMPLVDVATIHHATIAPADVCSWISQHPKALLLDVRTAEEFTGKANPDFGTLKGAVNIPVQELESRMNELRSFKDREILVYCSHSHRSSEASYALTRAGFTRVFNLGGGMSVVESSACKR